MRLLVDGRVIQDRYHGIGRQTFELIRALSSVGVDDLELVVAAGDAPAERLSARDLASSPGVRLVPFTAPVASAQEQVHWPELLRRTHPDVVLVPYHLATPLATRVPVVAMIHDCIMESSRAFAPGLLTRSLYRVATRIVISRAQEIVTVSEATRRALKRTYGVDIPVRNVVRNGIDAGFGDRCREADVGAVRAAMGLPQRYLLHVGVRRPHKNQATLVRALASITVHEPDLHLVLVGGPDERFPDPVPALVDDLDVGDRVHLIDSVPEEHLPAVFAGSLAFVFPSFAEGFGLPVLEAMSAGIPVVASSAGAVAEVVGDAAPLVSPNDVTGWAGAMRRIVHDEDLRERTIRAGFERVAAHPWDASAASMLAVLVRATSRGAGERVPTSPGQAT